VQGADVLLTIAEVAVAFAGFASVVVLFQHRDPHRWPPAVVVRLRTMIEGSLVTLFSALLPCVLHQLGLADDPLWAASSLVLALAYVAFGAVVWQRSRAPLASGQLSRGFSATVGAISTLVLAALLLNAAGVVFLRASGAYLVGVTWTLVFASLMFLRVVIFPIGTSRSR
jgi:hypothetical protein